jgi:hypothetical protein
MRRYSPLPRVPLTTTHYELVIDNGETEERRGYGPDECEMASAGYYRAKARGAFSVAVWTFKDDGSSYRSMHFERA